MDIDWPNGLCRINAFKNQVKLKTEQQQYITNNYFVVVI